jgi:hypothetical protein
VDKQTGGWGRGVKSPSEHKAKARRGGRFTRVAMPITLYVYRFSSYYADNIVDWAAFSIIRGQLKAGLESGNYAES